MDITVAFDAALMELGLTDVYKDKLENTEQTWKSWLKSHTAERYVDYVKGTSGLGAFTEKPVGSAFQTDRIFTGARKSFTLVPYGLALTLQHEALKYEWYGVYKDLGSSLANTAFNRYEVVAYAFFNRAFDTTDTVYTTYNGEALCSATHTRLDGGAWQNRPSDDVALSMDGLETAWEQIRKLVNDRGLYMNCRPRKLVVPTEMFWLAQTLVRSDYNPDNANMAYNNAKALGLSVLDTNYITDANFWFVLCDKDDYRISMGLGESPDLKTSVIPATRSVMYTSYCSFRAECYEGKGIWGSRGQ